MIGYIPTIRDLLKKPASANIPSYVIWIFASGISFLYAIFILKDLLAQLVMGLNLLCCIVIFALAVKLKSKK